jgi:Holin of 3TMs, for gene-transfer release
MFPILSLLPMVMNLMKGPLGGILDKYVTDLELRRKLQAELETAVMAHLSKETEFQRDVVIAESKSEHWLAACWRPLLMLVLTSFLILIGFFIPLADLIAGHPIRYEPRWQQLPVGFWDFLSIGVGGYIGGRSLEKITGQVFGRGGKARK